MRDPETQEVRETCWAHGAGGLFFDVDCPRLGIACEFHAMISNAIRVEQILEFFVSLVCAKTDF
jgi:hypothetical protein